MDPPISVDHGLNFKVGKGTFLNFNMLVLDTCLITIGERTLFGPNVSLYGATHPMDPAVRQGLEGPEAGKEIHIGDDVWIGGSVIILAGVTIGRGCTIGAGSVVTRVCRECLLQLAKSRCLSADADCRVFLHSTSPPGTLRALFDASRRPWTRTKLSRMKENRGKIEVGVR